MVTPYFYALCLLSVVAAVILAAVSAGHGPVWISALSLVTGFAASAAWFRPERLHEPVWVPGLCAAVAALHLVRPKYAPLTALFAGVMAGLSASLPSAYGLPFATSLTAAAMPPAIAVLLAATRPEFVPADLREEALLGLLTLSLLVALAPGLIGGWQSALALNVEEKGRATLAIPVWTFSLGLASMALGGAYAAWRRR
jgi:hypothetical protein